MANTTMTGTGGVIFGVPRRLWLAVAVAVVAAAVLTAAGTWGWFLDDEDAGSTGEAILGWAVSLVAIVIAAALVLWFGKRATGSAGPEALAIPALVFGALALLSFPGFWLGVHAPFAAGGIVLGVEAHQRGVIGGRRIMAYAGILLGTVGFVGSGLLNLFG